MRVLKINSYQEMSEWVCKRVIDTIKSCENPVLGLATGSTPKGLYQCLIEAYNRKEISFKNVTTFNLDEYIGLDPKNPSSYNYFMQDRLFNHVDIDPKRVFLPNGMATDIEKECDDFEALIKKHGPIDLQILGVGVNGHIAFNEPGTSFTSRTQRTQLTANTIEVNSRFFENKDDVPTEAITMGIGTIMESKEIILLISGQNKAQAVKHLVEGEATEDCPVTVIQKHPNATVVIDEEAASLLS